MDLGNGFSIRIEGESAVIEKDREDAADKVVADKAALIAFLQGE